MTLRGLLFVNTSASYRFDFFTDHSVIVRLDGLTVLRRIVSGGSGSSGSPEFFSSARYLAAGYHWLEAVAVLTGRSQVLQIFAERLSPNRELGLVAFLEPLTSCSQLQAAVNGSSLPANVTSDVSLQGASPLSPLAPFEIPEDSDYGLWFPDFDQGQVAYPPGRQVHATVLAVDANNTQSATPNFDLSIGISWVQTGPVDVGSCLTLQPPESSAVTLGVLRYCLHLEAHCDRRPGALCYVACGPGLSGESQSLDGWPLERVSVKKEIMKLF